MHRKMAGPTEENVLEYVRCISSSKKVVDYFYKNDYIEYYGGITA